ncbi:hypothetical protein [Halomarina rubra]|uniref:CARDB domain-containing protein n=1 Tax=Halomarina rubra TaxID=2071873 RepID=A0ABD6AXE6_9EURY|nr:hypothetical protein [Halomarina rubra]
MAPSRRDALRIGGTTLLSLTPLAGCLDDSDPSPGDETSVPTSDRVTHGPTTVPRSEDPTAVPILERDQLAVPELVTLYSSTQLGPVGDRSEQYLLVNSTLMDGATPPVESIELVAGESTYAPMTGFGTGYGLQHSRGLGRVYGTREVGWLVFCLPNPLEATTATVCWPEGELPVTATAMSGLTRPPTTFVVREFSTPDTVDSVDDAAMTFRVENTGPVDGTFVATVYRAGNERSPLSAIRIPIEGGSTASWDQDLTPSTCCRSLTGAAEGTSYTLRWRDGQRSTSITLDRPVRP